VFSPVLFGAQYVKNAARQRGLLESAQCIVAPLDNKQLVDQSTCTSGIWHRLLVAFRPIKSSFNCASNSATKAQNNQICGGEFIKKFNIQPWNRITNAPPLGREAKDKPVLIRDTLHHRMSAKSIKLSGRVSNARQYGVLKARIYNL